jgi:glycosyltransferase involved in cell wall biosynthesis
MPPSTDHFRNTLVITRCFPLNIDNAVYGIFQRFRTILQALCDISDNVNVVFCIGKEIINEIDVLKFKDAINRKWGISINPLFLETNESHSRSRRNEYIYPIFLNRHNSIFAPCSNPTHSKFIEGLIESNTDLIFVHRLNCYYPLFNIKRKLPPISLDLDDIEHKKFSRNLRLPPFWFGKLAYYLQIPNIFFGELKAVRHSSLTFVCSDFDKTYLKKVSGSNSIEVFSNSIEFPAKASIRRRKNVIVFVGSYTYTPNIDAADFLVNSIFPLIKTARPDTELWLIGNKVELLSAYGQDIPGVKFLGFVESLDEIYADASLVCCPIRSGGGTRIKIIEAAAHGLPIVSTTVGAEGLELHHNRDIVIADDAQDIALECIKILENNEFAKNIGTNARIAAKKYSKEAIASNFKTMLIDLKK